MTKIKLTLSESGIKRAAEEVKAYCKSLEAKADKLSEKLANEGLEAARDQAPFDTGRLSEALHTESRGNGAWALVSNAPHAAFVEFGTGVVGEGTYPAELPSGWEYNTAKRAEDEGWWYFDPATGYGYTRGQTGKAYMLAASVQMRQLVRDVAKEVFAK